MHPFRRLSTLLFLLGFIALGRGQQVPPQVKVEGVPPLSQELVDRMSQYQNMRSALFAAWHPAKREMLIATRFADTAQAHYVAMPEGARRQMTFFKEPVTPHGVDPAGGAFFVFSMDTGGSEFYQLYRFDFETGASTLLTDGTSRNSMGHFSSKGDRFSFVSTRRNGRDNDLWVMGPKEPGRARLVQEAAGGLILPGAWSPDDRRLLFTSYVSINDSTVWVLDLESGEAQPALPEIASKSSDLAVGWTADGKGVYVITDRDSEFLRLYRLDLQTRKLAPITPQIDWDVSDAVLSKDGSLLAYVVNEGGIDRLHLVDTATGRELPQPDLPPGTFGRGVTMEFHPARKELAFSLETAKSPSEAYSYDIDKRQVVRWTFSEVGGLNTESFPEPKLISYPTFDKVDGRPRMIPAFVTKPPARFKPPYPVLISIHGGPEGQSKLTFPRSGMAYGLTEQGIAVIEPNVRGSSGYGKTYLQLDNGMKREDTVKDIGALLDWVAAQPDLDADRVAVIGGSYGGYMSLAVMTHYSGRLKCGIELVGISHFATFLQNTQAYRRDLRRAEYGDEREPAMKDFFETIAPLNSADKIRVPMLVYQGKNDPRVPWTESEQIVAKVRRNDRPVWYILAENEGHGIAKKANRDYWDYVLAAFLGEHLLN